MTEFESKLDTGKEVIVKASGYEYSPEINYVGFDEICVYDMDGVPIDITEEEEERFQIEAMEIIDNELWYGC